MIPIENRHKYLEIVVVAAILLAVSAVLWWRFLPLPHQDLNFYTEPAYLLAKFGKLAGPGSQGADLTYQKGIYNYPPGYYLIVAGWIRLFGLSPDSLLGYAHTVHFGVLLIVWMLLRFRYGCSKFASSLALLSIFPRMANGRPDLTACLLYLAAWLALPEDDNPRRLVFSGCLAGFTLLFSPGYGIATLATLAILLLTPSQFPLRAKIWSSSIWSCSAFVFFACALSIVLSLQHSWALAYVQFRANTIVRGTEVNVLPDLHLLYTYLFSVIPFVFLALIPAAVVVWAVRKEPKIPLFRVSLAFLGAAVMWLAVNKSQLLLEHHYLFPAKTIFLGLLCSWPKLPSWIRCIPLLLVSTLGFYLYKADFLYLTTPLRQTERHYASAIHPVGEVAVDSLYFARFYRAGHTLNYETVNTGYWPKYLATIPADLRESVMSGLEKHPVEPSMVIATPYILPRSGHDIPGGMFCTQPPSAAERLRALGHTWNLPADPYAAVVCSRSVH